MAPVNPILTRPVDPSSFAGSTLVEKPGRFTTALATGGARTNGPPVTIDPGALATGLATASSVALSNCLSSRVSITARFRANFREAALLFFDVLPDADRCRLVLTMILPSKKMIKKGRRTARQHN